MSSQKQPAVILPLSHPKREAEKACDTMQSAAAHCGNAEKLMIVDKSGRVPALGTREMADTRLEGTRTAGARAPNTMSAPLKSGKSDIFLLENMNMNELLY